MIGLLLTRRSVLTRIRFVVLLSILACGLPLLGGLTTEFSTVFQYALLATLALIPIWVMFAVITRCWQWFGGHIHAIVGSRRFDPHAGRSWLSSFGSAARRRTSPNCCGRYWKRANPFAFRTMR